MKDANRYFLAIIPPVEVCVEVLALKNHFKEEYHSGAALRSPAHITLHMPFVWPSKKENQLISKLEQLAADQSSFPLELNGFGTFPPKVIYINVCDSNRLLEFQKHILIGARQLLHLDNDTYRNRGYHPHLTIAFRDLRKVEFHKAWEVFATKDFHASFEVKSFSLLKHNGKIWEVFNRFLLKND